MGTEQIIAGKTDVYIADVGTAAPDIAVTPSGSWTNYGDGMQTEDGVTMTFEDTIERTRVQNETLPVAAHRTEEDITIALNLLDLTVESLARALNNNSITTTAQAVGEAGTKAVNLRRGLSVTTMALLVRGGSPYGVDYNMQFWFPKCYVEDVGDLVFMKTATALPVSFMVLNHETHGAGQYIAQNSAVGE